MEAKKQDNKVKNRYTTIYPCMYYTIFPIRLHAIQNSTQNLFFLDDHSRIVLETFTAGEGDYINANYIEVRIDKELE